MIFHSANNLRKKKKKKKKKKKRKRKKKGKRKEGIKELKEKPHAITVTWPYLSSMAKFFLNLMFIG
jgi:ribosomal protein S2